jgi:hypothetical protein
MPLEVFSDTEVDIHAQIQAVSVAERRKPGDLVGFRAAKRSESLHTISGVLRTTLSCSPTETPPSWLTNPKTRFLVSEDPRVREGSGCGAVSLGVSVRDRAPDGWPVKSGNFQPLFVTDVYIQEIQSGLLHRVPTPSDATGYSWRRAQSSRAACRR